MNKGTKSPRQVSMVLVVFIGIGVLGGPLSSRAEVGLCGQIFSSGQTLLFERSQIEFNPRLAPLMPLISFEGIHQRFQHLTEGSALPTGYKVEFAIEETQSFASYPERKVSVGFFARTDLVTSAKATEAVFTHEMSHTIFDHNLRMNLPEYRQHKNLLEELMLKSQALEKEYRENNEQMNRLPDGPAVEALQDRNMILESELIAVSDKIKPHESLERLFSAYHELYADVGAVLVSRDPSVMKRALFNTQDSTPMTVTKALLLRDFMDGSAENKALWQSLKAVEVDQKGENYFALLPARWALGHLLAQKMQSPDGDRGLLTQVQRILEMSLKNQMALGASHWGANGLKNVEQINRELSDLFTEHLNK